MKSILTVAIVCLSTCYGSLSQSHKGRRGHQPYEQTPDVELAKMLFATYIYPLTAEEATEAAKDLYEEYDSNHNGDLKEAELSDLIENLFPQIAQPEFVARWLLNESI